MALSKEVKLLIRNQILLSCPFQPKDNDRIQEIIELASERNIRLEMDHEPTKNILIDNILAYRGVLDETPQQISKQIVNQIEFALAEDKAAFLLAQNGGYTSKPIHQRAAKEWLEDHDISMFMPKSKAKIEVLAPMSLYNSTFKALSEFIKPSLANSNIQNIIFPLGPGHWRAITITKPSMNQPKYKLEIFDSYGESSGQKVLPFLKNLLEHAGLSWRDVTVNYTTAPIQQKDGYSCGDYTCAYSHQKMLNLGVPQQEVNMVLVNALQKGNDNHALRNTILAQSQLLTKPTPTVVPHVAKTVVDTVKPTPTVVPRETVMEPVKPSNTTVAPQITKVTKKNVVEQEKPAELIPETHYEKHVKELLAMKDTLFKKAKHAQNKQKNKEPLSDEGVATILQVEELKKAGYR